MKRLLRLFLPGGILVLGGSWWLVRLPTEQLELAAVVGIRVLPALALILAWAFHRSRLAVAVAVVVAAWLMSMDPAAVASLTGLPPENVPGLLAVLLPLVLGGAAWFPQRAVLGRPALLQYAVVAVVLVLAGWPLVSRPASLTAMLRWQPLAGAPSMELPLAALISLAAAVLVLTARFFRDRDPVDRAILWSLVAVELVLGGKLAGEAGSTGFALASLVLAVGGAEASHHLAFRDSLTGLPGRRAFQEALAGAGRRFAVAMVDVDHFKRFNDRWGHETGDQVLQMVAARLEEAPSGGRAYRWGGEEFALLFPGRKAGRAVEAAESVRTAIEASGFVPRSSDRPAKKAGRKKRGAGTRGRPLSVTVSIGVAQRGEKNPTADAVVEAADRALYRAKRRGRNRVCS